MILDLWLLFGIKSKITTDDLVPEETGWAERRHRVRRVHQQSGSFAVDDDEVVIYHPGPKKNWVIPAQDVIWVRPEVPPTPESTGATIRLPSDPAIIPRLEVIQISADENRPKLCLVFRRPREVPTRHGTPRWADGAVLSAPGQAFAALDAAGVRSSPTLDDAVISFYGTLDAPLISSHETQDDWQVSGFALTSRGPYSHDPKPVARHQPNQNGPARERRQLVAGVLAGAAAALVAAVVWAVFAYFTGWEYWLAAVGVGFAVGWAVRWQARSTTRRPGLGVAAALIAFAAMMSGSIFLEIAQFAEELHVSVIRVAENPSDLAWGEMFRAPFTDWLGWGMRRRIDGLRLRAGNTPAQRRCHPNPASPAAMGRNRGGGGGHWRGLRPGARANAAGLGQPAKLKGSPWISAD